MIYNSKRGEEAMDSLNNMLLLINEVSKNTEDFHLLEEWLPMMNELRRADVDAKEMGETVKIITEMLPKLKGKMLPNSKGGETPYEVYDRMVSHLSLELGKLNSEHEDIVAKAKQAENVQEEQVKAETVLIIKQIEEVLVANRKTITSSIVTKRKQYLNPENPNHYLHRKLHSQIKARNTLRQKLEQCKYEFGQYRNKFILYESNSQSHEVKVDMQKLSYGKETGMSQEMMNKLESKIYLKKRKEFIMKSYEHIQRQYPFVLSNLRKLQKISNAGTYQESLYHHYFNWGKRIKIMIQSTLIRLSSFQIQRVNLKEQQSLLQLCKDQSNRYQTMLAELSNLFQ